VRRHPRRPDVRRDWPYRLEVQAKCDRRELGGGYSTVREARLELREESAPFGPDRPPPPPPWDLERYVRLARAGRFEGVATEPARLVLEHLAERGAAPAELAFGPRLVLITKRLRQHLNLRTRWGSGPNPEQAFIVTLDAVEVYAPGPALAFLAGRTPEEPAPAGRLFELELEFERNVSERLDAELAAARGPATAPLEAARAAFLADQRRLLTLVEAALGRLDVGLEPVARSKYLQACRVLDGAE